MGHYAKVASGKVVDVIFAEPEFFETFVDNSPGEWIKTSYNTIGGVHYGEDGKPDGSTALRKNFASVGYIYDRKLDAFYAPQPFPSWTLNQETCLWEPPVAHPDDSGLYKWDETTLQWILITDGVQQ